MRLLPRSPVEESALARGWVWLAFAVAAIAMAVYGGDYVVPALGAAAAAAGHAVSHRRRHRPRGVLRQAVIAGLVLACLAYFVLDSVGAVFGGQLPQAHFAMLLLAVTSFDLKTRRNLYSSLWISLAIVYLAAVYAWDYLFAVFALLWTLCLAGFWTASHLRRIRARPGLPLRPPAVALAAAALAGLGLFALLPQPSAHPDTPLVISLPSGVRFQGEVESPALPLVQFGGDAGQPNSIDLRYRGRLGSDVVMYVRTGAPGYWRGLVFDRYDGGAWTASAGPERTFGPYVDQRELPAPEGPQLGTYVQVYRPARTLPGVIYAASPVEAVYYPAAQIRRDRFGAWHAPAALRAGQTYSVVSALPDWTAASLRQASGPDEVPALDLDASSLSARGRDLARQAVAGAEGDTRYDRVMALITYLQKHYRYSLELGHAPAGRDPVDWFLFDARTGYCEQFASAAVLMLRGLGIPARLATGYATGDYDPVLNQAVVRERDAHAWVEVYFPGRGWVPVDPSPGFPALAASRFPDRFAVSGLAHLIPHLAVGAPAAALTGLGLGAILPGALALALAALAALAWLLARRPRPAMPAEQVEQVELLALYRRLQRRLGRRRAPPETPREYAATAPDSELLQELTEAVEAGVYGGHWPAPDDLGRLRAKLGAE